MDYTKTFVEITTEEYRQLIEDLTNARRDAKEEARRYEEEHSKYIKEWCKANSLQDKLNEMTEICKVPCMGESDAV